MAQDVWALSFGRNIFLHGCRVGDGVLFSKIYDFTTLPAVGSSERVKIVVTADLGKCTGQLKQGRRRDDSPECMRRHGWDVTCIAADCVGLQRCRCLCPVDGTASHRPCFHGGRPSAVRIVPCAPQAPRTPPTRFSAGSRRVTTRTSSSWLATTGQY